MEVNLTYTIIGSIVLAFAAGIAAGILGLSLWLD